MLMLRRTARPAFFPYTTLFRSRVKVFEQLVPEVVSLELGVNGPSQLSLAVGAVGRAEVGTRETPPDVMAPAAPIYRAVVSCTVMLCLTVPLVLLQSSALSQVRG